MNLAIVNGRVVATRKVEELSGMALKVIVPCDQHQTPTGEPIVAIDAVGARDGDLVMWVGKREASMAVAQAKVANNIPVDAAITGIVDAVR